MKKFVLAVLCGAAFSAQAERIHCSFEPQGRPTTYLAYDTKKKVAETLSGWNDPTCPSPGKGLGRVIRVPKEVSRNRCLRSYGGVKLGPGVAGNPYGKKGMSLVGFDGDVVILHMKLTMNTRKASDWNLAWPFEATWGDERLPANPDANKAWFQRGRKIRGVCWTDKMQAQVVHESGSNSNNGSGKHRK